MTFYYPKNDEEAENIKCKNVWFGFTGTATTHGVQQINKSKGYCKRLAWTIAFLGCTAGLGYQLYLITTLYFRYLESPVVLKQTARIQQFPAVSICNTNPVKASALHLSPRLQALIDSWQAKSRKRRDLSLINNNELTSDYGYKNFMDTRHHHKRTKRAAEYTISWTADNAASIYVDGVLISSNARWKIVVSTGVPLSAKVVAFDITNAGGAVGFIASYDHNGWISSDSSNWRCSDHTNQIDWSQPGFNDSHWEIPRVLGTNGGTVHGSMSGISSSAKWIWTQSNENHIYCRHNLQNESKTQCPALLPPGNGYFNESTCSSSPSDPSTICTAICNNKDDTLYGNSVVMCESDGKWNMTERPCCESSCTGSQSILPCGMPMKSLNFDSTMLINRVHIWPHTALKSDGKISQWRFYSTIPHTFYPSVWRPLGNKSFRLVGYNNITTTAYNSEQIVNIAPQNQVNASTGDYIGIFLDLNSSLWLSNEMTTLANFYNMEEGFYKAKVKDESLENLISQASVSLTMTYRDKTKMVALMAVLTYCEETTTETITTTVPTTYPDPESTTPKVPTTTGSSIYPDREPLREDYMKESEVLEALADSSEELKKTLGYELYELILSCQYENEKCNLSDFTHFFDAVYGNCYAFNFGSGHDTKQSTKSGHSSGLKMELNIGQNEYIEGISQLAGIVVVVHPTNRMPFPEDEGVLAAPGQITSIGISKVDISRLPDPYSNCSDENRNPNINVYEEIYDVEYSSTACYKTCYQRYVIETCNCSDPQYPGYGEAFGNYNWSSCSVRNIKQSDCIYGVQMDYIHDKLICTCPTPCSETAYRYSLSRAVWPSQVYMNDFVNKHRTKLKGINNSTSVETFLMDNAVKIEIYFKEFDYQRLFEKPKYPTHLYLADGCSIIGLWLGMSLLSLLEFLELLVDAVVVLMFNTKRQGTIKLEISNTKVKPKETSKHSENKPSGIIMTKKPVDYSSRRVSSTLSNNWVGSPITPKHYSSSSGNKEETRQYRSRRNGAYKQPNFTDLHYLNTEKYNENKEKYKKTSVASASQVSFESDNHKSIITEEVDFQDILSINRTGLDKKSNKDSYWNSMDLNCL